MGWTQSQGPDQGQSRWCTLSLSFVMLTSHSRPLTPFGSGTVRDTSANVCAQLYDSKSAPLPALGSVNRHESPLRLRSVRRDLLRPSDHMEHCHSANMMYAYGLCMLVLDAG